ncbi:MAG: hypothetical protein ABJA02_02090 [Acidobacteriota bacterium]
MKKQTLIIVALSLVLAIMPSIAFSQRGEDNGAGGDANATSLTGLWQVAASNTIDCTTGQPDGQLPVPVNYLFNQGGTMTEEEANSFDGPYRASAQGMWKQVTGRKFVAAFTNFAFNPDRTLAVTLKYRTNITIARDGSSFTERGTAEISLPDGTVVGTVCYADTATRFMF